MEKPDFNAYSLTEHNFAPLAPTLEPQNRNAGRSWSSAVQGSQFSAILVAIGYSLRSKLSVDYQYIFGLKIQVQPEPACSQITNNLEWAQERFGLPQLFEMMGKTTRHVVENMIIIKAFRSQIRIWG